MKSPARLRLLLVAALAAAPLYSNGVTPLTDREKEEFLKRARIIASRALSQGITGSLRVTMTDGKITHDAHVQTIDEFRATFTSALGSELNFRDTYRGNIAGYRLGRLLLLDMIPPSVERKVGGKSAAVTWWIDDVLMTEKDRVQKKLDPPDRDRWNRQMHIVRLFDQLIYNTDRNLGNLVITQDWNVWMIDHTRAFRIQTTLRDPNNLQRCDRLLLEQLRKLDRESLTKALYPMLMKAEIGGILARRDLIVKHFEERIAAEGEDAVLYDYLARR
ncbi:MAG: hypothetical protein KIT09_23205 [Bryobacteraceae bacterium]|nr:hypothetical protein [Bryobacteraceae bacterium]